MPRLQSEAPGLNLESARGMKAAQKLLGAPTIGRGSEQAEGGGGGS